MTSSMPGELKFDQQSGGESCCVIWIGVVAEEWAPFGLPRGRRAVSSWVETGIQLLLLQLRTPLVRGADIVGGIDNSSWRLSHSLVVSQRRRANWRLGPLGSGGSVLVLSPQVNIVPLLLLSRACVLASAFPPSAHLAALHSLSKAPSLTPGPKYLCTIRPGSEHPDSCLRLVAFCSRLRRLLLCSGRLNLAASSLSALGNCRSSTSSNQTAGPKGRRSLTPTLMPIAVTAAERKTNNPHLHDCRPSCEPPVNSLSPSAPVQLASSNLKPGPIWDAGPQLTHRAIPESW